MPRDDSTVLAQLERLPQEARYLRLELQGPSLTQRLPLMRRVTRFELTNGTWTCHWDPDNRFTFARGDTTIEVQLGERFTLDGQPARMLDLRTLAPYALSLQQEGEPGRHWELFDGTHLIGRPGKRQNQITLNHQSISRAHARLEISSERVNLVAESSSGLTAVNGTRLTEGVSLRLDHGDRIQLGEFLCLWHREKRNEEKPPGGLVVQLLGGLRVWNNGEQVSLRNEKSRTILGWLLVRNEGAIPVEQLLEALWPERPLLRQRKNLSHALKSLEADLGYSCEEFERLLPRTGEHLRLDRTRVARVDLWELQAACQRSTEVSPETLAGLHPAPLLPENSETWLETSRAEHFLAWLDLAARNDPGPGKRGPLLDAISNSLSGTEYPEFVYRAALALAEAWHCPDFANLWSWDFRNRIGTISEGDLVK